VVWKSLLLMLADLHTTAVMAVTHVHAYHLAGVVYVTTLYVHLTLQPFCGTKGVLVLQHRAGNTYNWLH
jgi:hypothetical protein